jgi:uncharacterized OB-fold protein
MTDSPSEARLRPAPVLTAENEFFWRGAAENKLLCHQCASCGRLQHPPTPLCPHCHANEWNLIELSGRGTVASFIIIHHPPNPWFELPMVAGSIDLEEGVQVISNICDIDPHDVRLGMPVVVFFAATEDDLAVPLFRPC